MLKIHSYLSAFIGQNNSQRGSEGSPRLSWWFGAALLGTAISLVSAHPAAANPRASGGGVRRIVPACSGGTVCSNDPYYAGGYSNPYPSYRNYDPYYSYPRRVQTPVFIVPPATRQPVFKSAPTAPVIIYPPQQRQLPTQIIIYP